MFKFKPFKLYNRDNNETIYAQGQLTTDQHKTLRDFLHVKDGEPLQFPHGAKLIVRGGNWYKIVPNNPVNGCAKVFFAFRVMRLCEQEQRKKERNNEQAA